MPEISRSMIQVIARYSVTYAHYKNNKWSCYDLGVLIYCHQNSVDLVLENQKSV